MTVPLTRTAAAHAGLLCAEQAGARLLLHHLHAQVAEYDRAVALETARRRDLIAHLETLFRHGPRPVGEVGGLTALTARCDPLQDALHARQAAERHLTATVADVALGPAHALQRVAARRGQAS